MSEINIVVNGNVSETEVKRLVQEEAVRMKAKGKELVSIEITEISPEELEVKSHGRAPIKRVRRITGYLAETDRFNNAKLDELRDRVVHY